MRWVVKENHNRKNLNLNCNENTCDQYLWTAAQEATVKPELTYDKGLNIDELEDQLYSKKEQKNKLKGKKRNMS